jgi:hypothetical protein
MIAFSSRDAYLLLTAMTIFVLELIFAFVLRHYHDTTTTREETVLKENARRLRMEAEAVLSASTFTQSARISREAVKLEMQAEALERERTDRATKTRLGRMTNSRLFTSRTVVYMLAGSLLAQHLSLQTVPLLSLPPSLWLSPVTSLLGLLPPWSDVTMDVNSVTYLGWVFACSMACTRFGEIATKLV